MLDRLPRPLRPLAITPAALVLAATLAHGVEIQPDRRSLVSSGHEATGHVRCGSGSGTAQLVSSRQVIVTAAHVLYGHGGLRGDQQSCLFEVVIDGQRRSLPIDVARIRSGTRDPYRSHASFDWAVARLAAPANGVTPYPVGGGLSPGQGVTLVSGRTLASRAAVTRESCQVRALQAADGGREALIDCSAQSGDSGAALIDRGGRVTAIYVGFRSSAPLTSQPFSEQHYNFAVAISPPMRAAIAELSR